VCRVQAWLVIRRRSRIVLREGRNRQIRRMVAAIGNRVVELRRVRFAAVRLGSLPEGAWRHLTASERKGLLGPLDSGPKASSHPP